MVTSVEPKAGPTSGGTWVTIKGENLGAFRQSAAGGGAVSDTPLPRVRFGTEAAASGTLLQLTDDMITVFSPPQKEEGTVDISVTTGGGTSRKGTSARFEYVAAEGPWRTVSPPKSSFSSPVVLRDGKVLVAGGCERVDLSLTGAACQVTASAALWDPSDREWSPTASMSVARVGHTATVLHDGKVLVAGGCDKPICPQGELASSEIYDPSSGRWTPTADMALKHSSHTATLLPRRPASECGDNCGKVLVVGASPDPSSQENSELYDPEDGTWKATGATQVTRNGHTAVLLRNARVLVIDGAGPTTQNPDAASELYDPRSGSWSPAAEDPSPRFGSQVGSGHSSTLLANGKVLVAGGSAIGKAPDRPSLYDPTAPSDPENPEIQAGAWSSTEALRVNRARHTATLLLNGKVLVAAGTVLAGLSGGDALASAASGTPLPNAELYDSATGRWSEAGGLASAMEITSPAAVQAAPHVSPFNAVLLEDGAVLVLGSGFKPSAPGKADKVLVNVAELYTPSGKSGDTDGGGSALKAVAVVVGLLLVGAVLAFFLLRRRRQAAAA